MSKPSQHSSFSSLNQAISPFTLFFYSNIPDSISSTNSTNRSQTFHFENFYFFLFLVFNLHTLLPYITTVIQHPSNISTFISLGNLPLSQIPLKPPNIFSPSLIL